MATNKSFGRLTANGGLEYAQTFVQLDGRIVINPSRDEYLRAGWLEIADSTPSPPDGHHLARTSYEERDGRILAVYEYAESEKVPRVFSKLYLLIALQKRGKLDAFLEMVERNGLKILWDAANELNEGYEGFSGYLATAKAALDLTDAETEAILGEAVAR